jgi:hypothetical protein
MTHEGLICYKTFILFAALILVFSIKKNKKRCYFSFWSKTKIRINVIFIFNNNLNDK